ncbi:derlin-1.1-like isoform X1 [Dioscorea cayenensis subsp. rotundata]|uniref:Derlin n=1 Tax=Dioscorea cayennensis subsp. rotundata TaxID=55577 RepID=A0AB40B800_DIOCR|nr:derlin-1.1-like isoform X1 [Dioscorea cayenensis subsp. rotundata]
MSSPTEYYKSLPPVTKTYGVICLMITTAYYFNLFDYDTISLSYVHILKQFQVWRLVTNFFFIAPFSTYFGIRLLMLARYGVLLEKGPFKERTADFLWMMIFGALCLLMINMIPIFRYWFLAPSLVFMILYVWSREVPNSQITFFGLVTFQGVYLPWIMLGLDLIFNNPLMGDIMGILAGHLYYFLAVLYPLSGRKNVLKTPLWVFKVVAYWGEGAQINSPVQSTPQAGIAFRGRSYRLNR